MAIIAVQNPASASSGLILDELTSTCEVAMGLTSHIPRSFLLNGILLFRQKISEIILTRKPNANLPRKRVAFKGVPVEG